MKYADLHIHTCFSDGTFTPEEIVKYALKGGLSAIAVTDHDCVEAVEQTMNIAQDRLEVIPGVELTAEMQGVEIHILGYFINFKDAVFQRELKSLYEIRLERARKILEKLNELGMEIKYDDLLKFAGKGTVGRLHIARMMCNFKYVGSIREAFQCFLGEGNPAYAAKFRLSVGEAIKLIKETGGLAVLAHPYVLGHDEWIPEFVQEKLDGIEVYYNNQDPQINAYYERIAQKFNLLMTGGTDCHGLARGKALLGKIKFPYGLIEKLKERIPKFV